MIGLGFILMSFGIAVPSIYWVIAVLVLIISSAAFFNNIYRGLPTYTTPLYDFLVPSILLNFVFPAFDPVWWMWCYFIGIFIINMIWVSIVVMHYNDMGIK